MPLVVAVILMAYVVMPAADRMLNRWLRSDIALRARILAGAVEQPLSELAA